MIRETKKGRRQNKILELTERYSIKNQSMLKECLSREGIYVDQSTLSRDIKEMNLIKGKNGEGYIKNQIDSNTRIYHRLHMLFSVAVRTIEKSGNVIVITCEPGMAPPVCSIIDKAGWSDIVGTIAGFDTIFVITK